MNIKVCGITSVTQLQQLQDFGVDYAGMIFYEKSARYAAEKLRNGKEEIRKLKIQKVGVFVNADFDTIQKAVEDYGLHYVQLHGDEPVALCYQIRKITKVIKAIRINNHMAIDETIYPYMDVVDYFLFDTEATVSSPNGGGREEVYGGTGKQFNWKLLEGVTISKPFFLSGGIGLRDIEALKHFTHPYLFAVDVNSRFETSAGVKDMDKVQALMNELKAPVSDTTKAS